MIKKKNFFPAIIVAVIVIFLVIIIFALRSQINALNEQYAKLNEELKAHQDTVDELNYEFTLSEKEYIEKYAREQLGFHKTGEIVFKDGN
ncbi:MAG: septum formation initiator family protein [Clostridia bacterium]|nr:septum formation initiator family protein [Clostridia bacterium]